MDELAPDPHPSHVHVLLSRCFNHVAHPQPSEPIEESFSARESQLVTAEVGTAAASMDVRPAGFSASLSSLARGYPAQPLGARRRPEQPPAWRPAARTRTSTSSSVPVHSGQPSYRGPAQQLEPTLPYGPDRPSPVRSARCRRAPCRKWRSRQVLRVRRFPTLERQLRRPAGRPRLARYARGSGCSRPRRLDDLQSPGGHDEHCRLDHQ